MADQGEQRRLAAIFAADMVGYPRLMEADEPWGNYLQTHSLIGIINGTIRFSRAWEEVI